MAAEWRNKAENSVEQGRPSVVPNGGFEPTPDVRVRQPLMAKEPLCGNQPTNLSLVIAVLRFPSCFAALLFWFRLNKEDYTENKYK
jgi:hypothetical protein